MFSSNNTSDASHSSGTFWARLQDASAPAAPSSGYYKPRQWPEASTLSDHQPVDQKASLPQSLTTPRSHLVQTKNHQQPPISRPKPYDVKPSIEQLNQSRTKPVSTLNDDSISRQILPVQGATVPVNVLSTPPDIPLRTQIATIPAIGFKPISGDATSSIPHPKLIIMEVKHPQIGSHEYTILPTDSTPVCITKAAQVNELLSSGHTLSAQLGLLVGLPDRYTPDTLAIEGMKPTEKDAWLWWARAEAKRPGSGAEGLPTLDLTAHRSAVPHTAPGNKSSVAEKTRALALVYGLPEGTLTAEHVAYFLRPENAPNVPILTAAHRVLKSRQHCTSSAGLAALLLDPRIKVEMRALADFLSQLDTRGTVLMRMDEVDETEKVQLRECSDSITGRIEYLATLRNPMRLKEIVKKQSAAGRKPAWSQ